jgi:hypothetical protein
MACYKSGGCGVYEMYSCSECPASKPEYLSKFMGMNEQDNLWYRLCVYYHAKTEMFDRILTDLRSPYDPTEAYIDAKNRKYSDAYAVKVRDFVLSIKKELGLFNCNLNDFNHYRYSAQKWIDEYNRLTDAGKMDFIYNFDNIKMKF